MGPVLDHSGRGDPGQRLIAAGRRAAGALILVLLGLGSAAVTGLILFGNPLKQGLSLAVDPEALLIAAVAAGVVGLLWALLILLTNGQLRRYASLSSGQSLFSGLVVLALIGGVALPAYKIGETA